MDNMDEFEKLSMENTQLKAWIKSRDREIDDLKDEINELEKERDEYRAKCGETVKQRTELMENSRETVAEILKMKKERDEYYCAYNEVRCDLEVTKDELQKEYDHRQQLMKLLKQQERELDRLKDLCESYEGTICGLCKALSVKGRAQEDDDETD